MTTAIVIVLMIVFAVAFVGYLMAQYEEGRMAAEHRLERKRRKREH